MIGDLLKNHIYAKTPFYKTQFESFGRDAHIWYPNLVLSRNLISIGDSSQILANSRIQCYPQKGLPDPHIRIGEHCYLGYYLSILAGADVIIDDWVLMASYVLITTETHGTDPESDIAYMDQPLSVAPVHIKSGTWLGEKVMVMPGVTIGEKCIVGAGSIVTKSIPDYCMAVGNPAKVIKKYNFNTHSWERIKG